MDLILSLGGLSFPNAEFLKVIFIVILKTNSFQFTTDLLIFLIQLCLTNNLLFKAVGGQKAGFPLQVLTDSSLLLLRNVIVVSWGFSINWM